MLAVALTLVLVGGGLLAASAHQSAGDDRGGSSARSARSATSAKSARSPTASPTTAAPTFAPETTAVTPSPDAESSLSDSVTQRDAELRRLAKKAQALSRKRRNERPVAEFTMASFNTLGATHRGGAANRTRMMRDLLVSHHVDVVALQEFQRPQRAAFARYAAGTYDTYPGTTGRSLDAENSVAWRRDTFDLVKGETRAYPYFGGHVRNMPRVLLRHRRTGVEVWVTSYHNPANIRRYGNQDRWRARGVGLQIQDANALAATRTPLIVAGDMNDRASYFCRMTGGTGMHSADGGNVTGGCHPPGHAWIDWILGSSDVTFSGYLRDDSGFVDRTSDHPVVVVTAKVKGKPGEGRYADGADAAGG